MQTFFVTLLMAFAGACLYRWRGHASRFKKYFPRPFNQIAFALPYALVTPMSLPNPFLIAGLVLVITTLAVLTGHGGFMDLGKWKEKDKDERLEFLIKPFETRIKPYHYDALGLAITGIAVSLPAGIVTLNPALSISGALKAPAYMLADKLGWGTEGGEWLTGAFLWGSLALTTL